MTIHPDAFVALPAITLLAALINGALGYGFSSVTLPIALLFYTNKVLNPAMVVLEVFLNSYTILINLKGVPNVYKRVIPVLFGALPGVALGSYVLYSISPTWLKLFIYLILLPLILLQAAGIRRKIRAEKTFAVPFGAAVGLLYSITTVSGPPLALFLNNQGLTKQEFRAALGLIRTAQALFTAFVYYSLGLYNVGHIGLAGTIAPSAAIGIPLGAYLIGRINAETFRRLCMSFDAWVVGLGLSKVLLELRLAGSFGAYGLLATIVAIDLTLLYSYFARRAAVLELAPARTPVV